MWGHDRRWGWRERPCLEGFEFNPEKCEKPTTSGWVAGVWRSLLSESEPRVFCWDACPSPGPGSSNLYTLSAV